MRNGLEAVTIVYDNNEQINHLKSRTFSGLPSYEFVRTKPSKTTIEQKLNILCGMYFSHECHVSVYDNFRVYRYIIFHEPIDVRKHYR